MVEAHTSQFENRRYLFVLVYGLKANQTISSLDCPERDKQIAQKNPYILSEPRNFICFGEYQAGFLLKFPSALPIAELEAFSLQRF